MASGRRRFTTYMNIEEDPQNARNLQKLEERANNTLRRIQRNAASTTSGAVGGRAANMQPGQVNALAMAERRRADSLNSVVSAQNRAAAASARTTALMTREGQAAQRAAQGTDRLARSLRLASAAATVAQGPLGPIAGRISALGSALNTLSGFQFGLVGAGALTAGFVRFAGTVQDLKSKLNPLFESQTQVNQAFRETQQIARDAKIALEPVVDLYTRLTIGGRQQGLSVREIARTTEIAAKAARLSGGTGVSQEAGLYQFAQGIGSGNIQGDELRSVRENTIRLAQAIADGLGVTVSDLKKMGAEGELTAKRVADALERSADKIDEELSRLPPTISQGTTALGNAFAGLLDDAEAATGVTGAFAESLVFLADNLQGVVSGIGRIAIAYAAYRASGIVQQVARETGARREQRLEILRTARATEQRAAIDRRASGQRLVQLRQERVALQAQLELDRQARTAAVARAAALRRTANSPAGDLWTAAQWREYRAAVDSARVANTNMLATQRALRNNFSALRAQLQTMTGHTRTYRRAMIQARAATLSLGRGALSLIRQINPLGIAISFLTLAMIELAFREDRAATSADRMADAQHRLGRLIDQTTGAITEQNRALIQNELLTNREAAREAQRDAESNLRRAGTRAPLQVRGASGIRGVDPRLQVLLRGRELTGDYDTDSAAVSNLSERLAGLQDLDRVSTQARDAAIADLARTETFLREAEQARAAEALLQGVSDPETRRRAFGNFSGEEFQGAEAAVRSVGEEADKAKESVKDLDAELRKIEQRTDKREDILARYDERSNALDKATRDARELNQLVGETLNGISEITDDNPLGAGIYTQQMADADRSRIFYGLRQPIRDLIDEQREQLVISRFRLSGYDLEADALERALSIQKQIGLVSEAELTTIIENERLQRGLNDALASRERQMEGITSAANDARNAVEDMLVNLRKDPVGAIENFSNTIVDNILRIEARRLTEMLFAGADAELRAMIEGVDGIERAAMILADQVEDTAGSMDPVIDANTRLADAADYTADRLRGLGDVAGGGGVSGLAPGSVPQRGSISAGGIGSVGTAVLGAARALGSGRNAAAGATAAAVFSAVAAGGSAGAILRAVGAGANRSPTSENGGEDMIVITGRTATPQPDIGAGRGIGSYGSIFKTVGSNLDGLIGTNFLGTVGASLPQSLLIGSVMSSLGLGSNTGAAIGGAIGSLVPIPGGQIIGSIAGSVIGGLLKGSQKGGVTIGGVGGALGISSTFGKDKYQQQGEQAASSLIDSINQIADAVGGTVNAAVGGISIGERKGNIRVDLSGTGQTKTGRGAIDFGEDAEAALAFALSEMLERGVIQGVSEASQRILQSGQDLQKAIEKAVAIESISKQLLQINDPTRYALQELNDEFEDLISYLQEGGASAQQYADAEELYQLRRQQILEQQENQNVSALQAYLDDLTGGSSSPFNAGQTYRNAASRFQALAALQASGQTVDSQELINAADDFKAASQAYNGSGVGFFGDFGFIQSVVQQAIDSASSGTGGFDDVGSPFDGLNSLIGATNTQTDIVSNQLGQIINLLGGSGTTGGTATTEGSTIGLLPGYGYPLPGSYNYTYDAARNWVL